MIGRDHRIAAPRIEAEVKLAPTLSEPVSSAIRSELRPAMPFPRVNGAVLRGLSPSGRHHPYRRKILPLAHAPCLPEAARVSERISGSGGEPWIRHGIGFSRAGAARWLDVALPRVHEREARARAAARRAGRASPGSPLAGLNGLSRWAHGRQNGGQPERATGIDPEDASMPF